MVALVLASVLAGLLWDRLGGTLIRADVSDADRYGVPGEVDRVAGMLGGRQAGIGQDGHHAASGPTGSPGGKR